MQIPIFKAEIEAGLAEAISNSSITLSSVLTTGPALSDIDLKNIKLSSQASSFDLYPLNTILVSTGWNKNADIFDKYETWAAKHTPEDKPLNIEHNHNKIVGHITSCSAIDAKGNPLADSLALDEVPDFFHILTSAVLYKELKQEAKELKQEIESIIAEIAEGKWFVSMECLFRGFDYGIIDNDKQSVVARTQDTAFLTKYLSAYGGKGEYNGKKIGRVLRNITFSGKGLVRNPANPYSIIIAEQLKPTIAEFGGKMANDIEVKCGLLEAKLETVSASEQAKTAKLAEATEQLDKLTKKLAKAEEAIAELDEKKDKKNAKIEKLESEYASYKTEAESKITKLTDELAEAVKMFNAVRTENDKIKADQKNKARTDSLKTKDMDAKAAEALVSKFENLDDEAFAAIVSLIPNKPEPKPAVASTEVPKTELEQPVEIAGAGAVAGTPSVAGLTAELEAYFKKSKGE